jgi:hypothetical protein
VSAVDGIERTAEEADIHARLVSSFGALVGKPNFPTPHSLLFASRSHADVTGAYYSRDLLSLSRGTGALSDGPSSVWPRVRGRRSERSANLE